MEKEETKKMTIVQRIIPDLTRMKKEIVYKILLTFLSLNPKPTPNKKLKNY